MPKPARALAPAPPRPFVRRWLGRLGSALLGLGGLLVAGGGFAAYVVWTRVAADLPSVDGLRGYAPPVMSRVYAGDGRLLAELASERRIFVPYAAIPERVRRAFVSAEDKDYWIHGGINPLAIARAGMTDLTRMGEGRRPLGASTITQQVAKNMLLDSQMTLKRKVEEAILAIRMEQVLSKERILEIYLNEIYLGQGAYGVQAAAQAYFNRPLDQLSLAQAAMLAALPKAPQNYNPFRHPDQARVRRDWVLDRMVEDHVITRADADAAQAEKLVPTEFRGAPGIAGADWYAEEVRQELFQRFGAQEVNEGGLTVRTSLNPVLQVAAETALRDGLMAYDRRMGGWRGAVAQVPGGPGLERNWPAALAAVAAPPAMLPAWRLAVVLAVAPAEARVGWIDQPAAPGGGAQSRAGLLRAADEAWNRPMDRAGHPGAAYHRLSDMLRVGDVVMVQPTGPGRAVLRQVPEVQGALVSLDPLSGRVLAMVGGWSYAASQFNRATQAQRQPGSSFKPIVYLSALEKGVSPSDRFLDAPLSLPDGHGGLWRPNNYEMEFNGPTPLRVALEQSLNLVTVRVAQRVGMEAVAQTAEAFGMADKLPRVLPAALGAVGTTVLRETGAYASFAAMGRKVVPTLIDSVQDREGHVVWRPAGLDCACDGPAPPDLTDGRAQIADPQSTFQLVTMMQGVVTRGTGVPAGKGLNRTVAGKTGTSQDFTDAWFAGFTPQMATVVWVGYDNPSTLGEKQTGAEVAAPIWHDYMAAALKGRPALGFSAPPGVTMAGWDTGRGRVTDAFKPGQVPGGSAPLGGEGTDLLSGGAADARSVLSGAPGAGGVDSGLGGLY
ncbi:MAG: PBP1A family penicillin-binding protein [Acetobacteraceae bacterium]|nr:PBP1A family penicillin-binding protein [Acetobacteraceae bacterium]